MYDQAEAGQKATYYEADTEERGFGRLSASVGRLNEAVDYLVKTLGPVLNPDSPHVVGPDQPTSAQASPLAELESRLSNEVTRIVRLRDRIDL